MDDVATALHTFFSSFGIPDYVEHNEDEDAQLPYITHELIQPDWGVNQSFSAKLWYNDSDYRRITAKVNEIRKALGNGISISWDSGIMYLWADSNWAQNYTTDDEPNLKCIVLSFIIQVIESY